MSKGSARIANIYSEYAKQLYNPSRKKGAFPPRHIPAVLKPHLTTNFKSHAEKFHHY